MSETMADACLVGRAQEGYFYAFEILVDRHAALVYRVSLRMVGNHHDAQDLAQDCFMAAWRNLDRFCGEPSFSTWLYRITIRQALSRLSGGIAYESPDLLDLPDGQDTDHTLTGERQPTVDGVTAAVAALPMAQRTAVVLHHLEGLSYEQAAEVTHSSVASVRRHLYRARRSLSANLASQSDHSSRTGGACLGAEGTSITLRIDHPSQPVEVAPIAATTVSRRPASHDVL